MTSIMKCGEADFPITRSCEDLDKAGLRGKVKIAFDEWNLRAWHVASLPGDPPYDNEDPEIKRLIAEQDNNLIASEYNMADALFTATFFNACLRHAEDVTMTNIAPLVNTRGPLYVHSGGLVKRTHFHAIALYANELQARVAKVAIEADPLIHGDATIPIIDAVATVDESGRKWAIALTNRHPSDDVACTVTMKDSLPDGMYNATVLAGDAPDAYNDIDNPDRVVPEKTQVEVKDSVVNLPPHSLTIVEM